MQPAIHTKRTIDFNKNFRSLLEVLKLVAISEYRNLEKRLKTFERLEGILAEFFDSIDIAHARHPFFASGAPPAIVAVTSDAGLLGGLNNQVTTRAVELVRQTGGRLVVVGERGVSYAQDAGVSCISYPGIIDSRRYGQAAELRDFLLQKVMAGEWGGLHVVYPKAHSFVVHRVETATLLPFKIQHAGGGLSAGRTAPDPEVTKKILFESSPTEVVEYLVFLVVAQRLYEMFGYARVCEQAARYLHLEESCNKILEMNKKLHLLYFKRRHEVIDANMRELFSSRKPNVD